MGSKLKNDIAEYFSEAGHDDIQMIVMGHKPAQIVKTAGTSCDTIYITTYNGAALFKNFDDIYKSNHDFHGIIQELNRSYCNYSDGASPELCYGMIKYNRKEETFVIIDRNRTTIYDSTIGFLDLQALSLTDELDSNEISKLIDYIKPLMNSATDRNTINKYNYQFYFNKFLNLRGTKIQNDVLTKGTVRANCMKWGSYIVLGLASVFWIYSLMCSDTSVNLLHK